MGDILQVLVSRRCADMPREEMEKIFQEMKKGTEFKKINKKGEISKVKLRLSDDGYVLLHGSKKSKKDLVYIFNKIPLK